MSKNFEAKLEEIKLKYATKCKISILPFHDFTINSFKNFLECNVISNYCLPKDIDYKLFEKILTNSSLNQN
jgi:hypothetical protein